MSDAPAPRLYPPIPLPAGATPPRTMQIALREEGGKWFARCLDLEDSSDVLDPGGAPFPLAVGGFDFADDALSLEIHYVGQFVNECKNRSARNSEQRLPPIVVPWLDSPRDLLPGERAKTFGIA